MSRTRIKICGIMNSADAQVAERAGCDAIGMVFWPGSKRCVTVRDAVKIVRSVSPLVTTVGVFVDAGVEEIARTLTTTGINAVQLCGTLPDGPWDRLARTVRLIRAIGVGKSAIPSSESRDYVSDYLLDNSRDGMPGGTGETFDWLLAGGVAEWGRLWLAGGLNPDNVAEAIRAVEPYAVDVSSGVEDSPGQKSAEKIAAFIASVRETDSGNGG